MGSQGNLSYKELVEILGEPETKVRYWKDVLSKVQLIEPVKGFGGRLEYSQSDLDRFETLCDYMKDGANTVTEAIRLMKGNITPKDAIELYEKAQQKFEMAQTQIAVLNKKVVELRHSNWLFKLVDWFKERFPWLRKGERQEGIQ